MLIADGSHNADLSHEPERMGSNVGTAGVVADILGEQFFASVRSREPCLDRYARNRPPLTGYLMLNSALAQVVPNILSRFRSFPPEPQLSKSRELTY